MSLLLHHLHLRHLLLRALLLRGLLLRDPLLCNLLSRCLHLRDLCGLDKLLLRVETLEHKLCVVGKTLVYTEVTFPEIVGAKSAVQVPARLLSSAVPRAAEPRSICDPIQFPEKVLKALPLRPTSAASMQLDAGLDSTGKAPFDGSVVTKKKM